MKKIILLNPFIYFLFLSLLASTLAVAQQSYEMSSTSIFSSSSNSYNPGTSLAWTEATTLLNTNNPTGNSFSSSGATVRLNYTAVASNTQSRIEAQGTGAGTPVYANFSSLTNTVGAGISSSNYFFNVSYGNGNGNFTTEVKAATVSLVFSAPISGLVIHFSGIGNGNNLHAYYKLTSGQSISRISGTTNFVVDATNKVIKGTTLSNATNTQGSVSIAGTTITSVTFDVYAYGDLTSLRDLQSIGVSYAPCTPPSITTQPLATQTVAQNLTPAALTVVATGATTYQWYRNTTNSTTGGTAIPGATTATYTPPTSSVGTTYYYVEVSNGTCSVFSNIATVNVLLDTDGDGVPDATDLDNDNDGILDALEKTFCDIPNNTTLAATGTGLNKGNLIFFDWNGKTLGNGVSASTTLNGVTYTATISNYTNTTGSTNGAVFTGYDIDAWAGNSGVVGLYNLSNVKEGFYTATAPSGANNGAVKFDVTFTCSNPAIAFQMVPIDLETVTSGQESITFTTNGSSFTLLETNGAAYTASVNGQTLTYTNTEQARIGGTGRYGNGLYTSDAGNGGKLGVTIQWLSGGTGKQGVGFALRLYCDTDGDGLPNYLDLDSDGDGCPDAVEGDDNVTPLHLNSNGAIGTNAEGVMNSNGIATVNVNGVPQLVNTGGAAQVDALAQGQGVGSSLNAAVNPCNNVWVGSTGSNDWNTATNWKSSAVPIPGTNVEFATSPEIKNDLQIPANADIVIGNLKNLSTKATIIPPASSLTINGLVTGSETNPDKIQIQASTNNTTPNATVRFNCANQGTTVIMGTVKMYVKGQYDPVGYSWTDKISNSPTFGTTFKGNYHWQFFGVPVEEVSAVPSFYSFFVREYDEAYNDPNSYYMKWHELNTYSKLKKFKGYEITQKDKTPAERIITIQGKMVLCDQDIILTREARDVTGGIPSAGNAERRYGLGYNIFGNSFTAAIPVNKINFDQVWLVDASGNTLQTLDNSSGTYVEKAVYLYNTGSFGKWADPNDNGSTTQQGSSGNLAGQYIPIPYNTGSLVDYTQIPSMNSFLLYHKGTFGTRIKMKLPYTEVVKNTKIQTAPRFKSSASAEQASGSNSNLSYLTVSLDSKSTKDKLWLVSQPGTSDKYDDGWDGRKSLGTNTAFIYTSTPNDGLMQINATDNLLGTYIYFVGNNDPEYTLTLKKTNLDNRYQDMYLVDFVTNKVIPLDKDVVTYTFTASNNGTDVKRFQLRGGNFLSDKTSDVNYINAYIIQQKSIYLQTLLTDKN